ncbi:MAG TPA: glucosyl-3-phosphoglycerate synthase [Actinomycetota bacterium]
MTDWFERRTFHHERFGDLDDLRARKQGAVVSVCIPTLNEAGTVGGIVAAVREHLMDTGLVDEIAVMDSASTDGTAEAAERAGATVFQDAELVPSVPHLGGKGDAMWKSLFVLRGDIILWVDADVTDFHPRFVYGLLGPLLHHREVGFVKGFYERPLEGAEADPLGGGRVTELLARPLLNAFWPKLSGLIQPLSGEYGGRREVLEQVPFFTGYAVEIGLLVDVAARFGVDVIAQVDLVRRTHRNRTTRELSRMAYAILEAAAARLRSSGVLSAPEPGPLHLFDKEDGRYVMEATPIPVHERPPASSVAGYRGA